MFNRYKFEQLQNKVISMGVSPLDILVVGVTGAGKSTTLNTLFGTNIVKVGHSVDPETMSVSSHKLNKYFRIWDTPGLGDGTLDVRHSKVIMDTLYKTYDIKGTSYGFIDLVLVIIEGSNRDMGTTYNLLNNIIVPNFQKDRIIVAINQADLAMKGRHWNYDRHRPQLKLENFLEQQSISIKNRVLEATQIHIDNPICYSAEYNYNVDKLMDKIISKVPHNKRDLIS